MEINTSENIAKIFSIFHDGGINGYSFQNDELTLTVDIMYLAQRIDTSFKTFKIIIKELNQLSLTTWPDDSNQEPEIIKDTSLVFEGDLEILDGEIEKNLVKIIFNQTKPKMGYCGGYIHFQAKTASVEDEAGKEYSIKELTDLAKGYWQEWEQRKKT